MNELLCLLIGIILLLGTIFDFFFTTISISGAGFLSRGISLFSFAILHYLSRFTGRRIFAYSGIIVNLSIFFTWLILIWIGLFFVYSSDPESIMNSQGRVANNLERLYFTGYVLSTLGMGNFYPTTTTFETISSVFSFFGFIFFTSSITFFLSVSGAVINKRTLARSIDKLGKTPESIATTILDWDKSYSFQIMRDSETMIDRYVVNHQAYPVVHYYSHPEPAVCLGINIVRLDEALSLILTSESGDKIKKEANLLRTTVSAYLHHLDKNYSNSLPKGEKKVSTKPLNYNIKGIDPGALNNRRKILRGLLRSEGFEWEDISSKNK